jgi:nicotinamide riboside kinase
MVESMSKFARGILFCDTDNLTTQIFAQEYFNDVTCDIKYHDTIKYDLYLLLTPDVPWVDDGQRNLCHKRKEMFDKCKEILDKNNLNYVIISGSSWVDRLNSSLKAINKMLKSE